LKPLPCDRHWVLFLISEKAVRLSKFKKHAPVPRRAVRGKTDKYLGKYFYLLVEYAEQRAIEPVEEVKKLVLAT
jgi:hypothetical protein